MAMNDSFNEGAYASTLQRGPNVMASSYARQAPASLSPIHNFKSVSEGEVPGTYRERVPDTPRNAGTEWVVNSQQFNGNFGNDPRRSPPASPISRAKLAVGVAQSEIAKINSFVDEEKYRKKPPGTWKNMGTPGSESFTIEAQKQKKYQYRLDLEKQIQACRMRKAEEERKEKDCNDHPLGPEYARPAQKYYNPPHRNSFDPPSVTKETAPAAVTKYIKDKYALGVSSGVGGNAIVSSSGNPPETRGSTTVLNRAAPHQKKKKDKAVTNLMKSRMHPGDQNQSNTSPRVPMNQFQTGGSTHPQQRIMQPGNGSRIPNQMQQQSHPPHRQAQYQQRSGFPAQFAHPTGPYPARPYGIHAWPMPMANAPWPMPVANAHPPPCNPYYGQQTNTQSAHPNEEKNNIDVDNSSRPPCHQGVDVCRIAEGGENIKPMQQISSEGQDFLFELKTKLKSERDLVERRLKEKVESTQQNINLLKYTMAQ